MTKQIIIDWQRDGLFVAMGTRRGNTVSIDTLVTTGGEGTSGSSTQISTQLFALAKQLDLHKSEATVIAPREVLEFRALTVPRGDADEIPDMVRFQAQRQMASIGDTWPLDYVLLPDQPGSEGISALATTISPAHMAEIEATCSDLGITLTRVLARPVEIARWGVSVGNLSGAEAALVISISQTQADLLAVSYGSLVQIRSARLPSEPNLVAAALVAEIRRSLMAAAPFLNNQPLTQVVLIAAPEVAERVERQVAEATSASVSVVDPASILPAKLPERHELAQRSASRLAALAGVLSNPGGDNRTVIDLKNCKKRQPKRGYKREMIIGGAAAALLLLGGIFWYWSTHAQLDMMIAARQSLEVEKAKDVKAQSDMVKHRADVDRFLAGSINWLDELTHIAQNAPASRDVVLSNPQMDLREDRTGIMGQIKLTAVARNSELFQQLRKGLSSKERQVIGGGPRQLPNAKNGYAWGENEVIQVATTGWDPLAKPKLPATTPPATTPPTTTPPTDTPAATPPAATRPTNDAPSPDAAPTSGSTEAVAPTVPAASALGPTAEPTSTAEPASPAAAS